MGKQFLHDCLLNLSQNVPIAPSSAPASLFGSTLSPTAAVFTWTPPPAEDQNGVIVMYFMNLTQLGGGLAQQYTTSNTSIVVSNLLPYRYYACIVAAATKVGTGPYTIIFTIQTPQAGMDFLRMHEYCAMPCL